MSEATIAIVIALFSITAQLVIIVCELCEIVEALRALAPKPTQEKP